MVSKIILGAFVQTRPKFGQNEENIEEALRLASKVKSDIYVFPELCNTGYAFTSKRECHSLAESLKNGPSVDRLQSFSEKKRCTIVAGLAEKDGERTYNSSIVIERGTILETYRKMHLFFREKLWFSESNSGFKAFNIATLNCRIGVLICFDWIFPEASRKLVREGAEVICHPSDLVLPGKAQIGMMARAFENRVFVITANRVGLENRGPKDRFRFTGKSQIVSPEMEKLVSAGTTETTTKVAKIDLRLARRKLVTPLNDLFKDMRTDYY
ncbi:MAG: nitrilase-related carbon-nitrogen hydrolase [Nitrososphaerales archaeon]